MCVLPARQKVHAQLQRCIWTALQNFIMTHRSPRACPDPGAALRGVAPWGQGKGRRNGGCRWARSGQHARRRPVVLWHVSGSSSRHGELPELLRVGRGSEVLLLLKICPPKLRNHGRSGGVEMLGLHASRSQLSYRRPRPPRIMDGIVFALQLHQLGSQNPRVLVMLLTGPCPRSLEVPRVLSRRLG